MRKENLQRSTQTVLGIVLVVALALMINWVGARHWKRADWTETHLYTLSEKSLNILGDLNQDVQIIVFMTPASTLYRQAKELLNRYDAASDRISVEFIDPDRAPLRTRELVEKFGISVADTVVFSSGDRSKYVTAEQMADFDYSGMQMGQPPSIKTFKGEERFTSAILSLVAPEIPKVYFVEGHGEPTTGTAPGGQGRQLSVLGDALTRENMEVREVNLLAGHVPEDASVLAIIGPTRAFAKQEISAIQDFLHGGGEMLLALDPLIEADGRIRSTGLEAMLKEWGVEVQDDLVIDPSRKIPFYDLSAVYLDSFGNHPIAKGMDGLSVVFLVARSLSPLVDSDFKVTEIVQTTVEGWGELNLGALLKGEPVEHDTEDLEGPVSVALAVEVATPESKDETKDGEENSVDETQRTRIVVFGDSDFLGDEQITGAGNQVLVVNAFNWLAAQENSLGIPSRDVTRSSLFLSSSQLNFILLLALVLMPGAAILAGILVWRRRKH